MIMTREFYEFKNPSRIRSRFRNPKIKNRIRNKSFRIRNPWQKAYISDLIVSYKILSICKKNVDKKILEGHVGNVSNSCGHLPELYIYIYSKGGLNEEIFEI